MTRGRRPSLPPPRTSRRHRTVVIVWPKRRSLPPRGCSYIPRPAGRTTIRSETPRVRFRPRSTSATRQHTLGSKDPPPTNRGWQMRFSGQNWRTVFYEEVRRHRQRMSNSLGTARTKIAMPLPLRWTTKHKTTSPFVQMARQYHETLEADEPLGLRCRRRVEVGMAALYMPRTAHVKDNDQEQDALGRRSRRTQRASPPARPRTVILAYGRRCNGSLFICLS